MHEGMLKSVKYLDAAGIGEAEVDQEELMLGDMEGFEDIDGVESIRHPSHRIHFRLIQRPQMTTLALPASPTWPSDAIPPHTAPWHFLPDVLSYSRFLLASPDYMFGELERELKELKTESEMLKGDTLGLDFVRAAKEKVERQVEKVKSELVTEMVGRSERESREAWAEVVGGNEREAERRSKRHQLVCEREKRDSEDVPTEFLATQDSTSIQFRPNPMPSPKRSRRRPAMSTPAAAVPSSSSYYFYQSSLGANVFLHPLDIRILLAHFKSYSLFPSTLSLRSTGFDPSTINDELRKRCKYLSHLPAGTEVIFVEAELEAIVGRDGLEAFEQPLKARREKRRTRVKREDRAKSRWEKAEREKIPIGVMSSGEDRDFSFAVARSALETTWIETSVPQASPPSVFTHDAQPSPSASPSNLSQWGAHPQPRPTFASALHSAATNLTPSPRRDMAESDSEVDAAWEAFDRLSVGARSVDTGTARESEKGEGRRGGKKGQRKMVLGGGGGRRA